MDRIDVSSSNIKAVGYDKVSKVLEVEFHNSGIYHYTGVPQEVVQEMLRSTSVGKYFNSRIKNTFKFQRGEFKKVELPNIYICGKAGAGKSILTDYLIATYGYRRSKFAAPIYGIGRDHFDMTAKDRQLLQTIGTEAGRDFIDENIWVNRFAEDLKIAKKTRELLGMPHVPYVSDDTRFFNEHKTLRKEGWVGIYLDAPKELRIQRLIQRDGTAQEANLEHKSETDLEVFSDELIQLDSTVPLEELYKAFDELLQNLTR